VGTNSKMWNFARLTNQPDGQIALAALCCLLASLVVYAIISHNIVAKAVPISPFIPEYLEDPTSPASPMPTAIDEILYVPLLAWNRAFNFLCIAILFAFPTGLLNVLIQSQLVSEEVRCEPWIFMTVFCFAAVFIIYWIVWPRWTLIFDRRLNLISSIAFALLQGVGSALLISNVYYLCAFVVHLKAGTSWGITWCAAVLWDAAFTSYYWNLYVLPEHNSPASLQKKMIVCDLPNLTVTLTYLVLWDTFGMFICIQTFAALGKTIFMRFPSPFTTRRIQAAVWNRGICGLPTAVGYEVYSLKNDQESRSFFDREVEDNEAEDFEFLTTNGK
jgi:hypothetical protein